MKTSGPRAIENPHILEVINDKDMALYMIDLPLPLPGFQHQITSWLLKDKVLGKTFLVDIGPASVNPELEKALVELEIEDLDYILLTHIHLDHAGGIGHLLKTYPHARIIVPYHGKKHLIDPDRLWHGSLATLGDMVLSFGEMLAISEEDFAQEPELPERLRIIDTPGHALHHQSFLYEQGDQRILFPGEAAGVILSTHMLDRWTKDSPATDFRPPVEAVPDVLYMSPASPPIFKLEIARESLSRLLDLKADLICYSHYGFSRYPLALMKLHLEQMELWSSVVRGMIMSYPDSDDEDIIDRSLKVLMASDSFLSCYSFFDADVRDKEHFFLTASLRGFVRFVRTRTEG